MIRILLTCIFIFFFPALIGTIFFPLKEKGGRLAFSWVFGQITLWAGFLFVSVPVILMSNTYFQVRMAYLAFCVGMLLVVGMVACVRWRKGMIKLGKPTFFKTWRMPEKTALVLWILFLLLVGFQLFCVFYLMFEDGDDSYYVAITTYCRYDKKLYQIEPYTGYTTQLDVRHALAPFPVWVAVLAEISGLSGAATSHIIMAVFTLLMAYGFYGMIGERLMDFEPLEKSWKRPLFLVMVALLVTFGGYSIYSPEKFLITRAAQGKAVLANVIIPAIIYLLMLTMERLEKKEKVPFLTWLAFFATMTAGCLCSSFGGFLICILMGVCILCASIAYRRWLLLVGAAFAMITPVVVGALYVTLPSILK